MSKLNLYEKFDKVVDAALRNEIVGIRQGAGADLKAAVLVAFGLCGLPRESF